MRYALIAAWQRFREVRHQQRLGYEGPLAVYAAFYAELRDWTKVLQDIGLVEPDKADVKWWIVRNRRKQEPQGFDEEGEIVEK